MSLVDTNIIIGSYLRQAGTPLYTLVGKKIYCPRAPENAVYPFITFFTRGGTSTPYIPDLPNPSVQFDCWAKDTLTGGVVTSPGTIKAREVYRALYDRLQGIQNVKVTIGATDYYILSAIEEVQGQDLQDVDIPGRYRVLTFFSIMVR